MSTIKKDIASKLLKSNLLKPYYVVEHSYTDNGKRDISKLIVSKNQIFPCLTTRPDTLGIVWKENLMPTKLNKNDLQCVDYRYDLGIRGRTDENCVSTITTKSSGFSGCPMVAMRERESNVNQLRIRKITPKDSLRLMGFTDKDYESMRLVNMNNSAIWHMAGDSIITTCLVGLLAQFVEKDHAPIIENYIEKEILNGRN